MKNKKIYLCVVAALLVAHGHSMAQDEDDPRTMFIEAQAATAAEEFDKAAEILAKLNKMRPDDPTIAFFLGYNLHAAGKLDEAIDFHKQAAKADNFKNTAFYNLACAYSLKDDADKSFDYLKKSIEAGFRDADQLSADPDFENVKDDARFEEMVALIKNDGKVVKKMTAADFYGQWKVGTGVRSGKKIADDRKPTIKIDKETFTIPTGPDSKPFVMSYKMKLDKKPITVDFEIKSGPVSEGKAKGIMKFDDDGRLVLCYEPKGEKRPDDFISTAENGFYVFKMKKVTKSEKKEESAEGSEEKTSAGSDDK